MANFETAYKYVMSQLPTYFAGRSHELAILKSNLNANDHRSVLILGHEGVGKSALVGKYIAQASEFFVGGIFRLPRLFFGGVPYPERQSQAFNIELNDPKTGPSLLVIEDCEQYQSKLLKDLITGFQRSQPGLRILATSRTRLEWVDSVITLGPLAADEMRAIWESNFLRMEGEDYQRLYDKIGGNPLVATLAGRLVRDGRTSVNEIDVYFRSFSASGIVGPDGLPITRGSEEERELVSNVEVVSNCLFDRISKDPQEMYTLSPRQFEQFVADLFHRQGYEVTLTPASKDGGKDIYVAKREAVGSLLYLVECKQFAPDRPVGVGLIRQLYGVVEQEDATGGILATTSFFTKGAKQFTEKVRYRLSLMDYIELKKGIDGLRSTRQSQF